MDSKSRWQESLVARSTLNLNHWRRAAKKFKKTKDSGSFSIGIAIRVPLFSDSNIRVVFLGGKDSVWLRRLIRLLLDQRDLWR
jgi:hypothetical protein